MKRLKLSFPTAVRYLVVLMLVAALSVVSAHKASATQPYALQPSQLTTFSRSRTADGHTLPCGI